MTGSQPISLYTNGFSYEAISRFQAELFVFWKEKKINLGVPIASRHFYDSYNASMYSERFFNTTGVAVNNFFTA